MATYPVHLSIKIDHKTISENNLCDEVKQVIQALRPSWIKDENGALKAKVFTGGISNLLFGYYIDGKFNEDVILVRIYGEGSGLMIDRETEKKNIQALSAVGRCPPLYAEFNNGIAYGFAYGVTLDVDTVRDQTIRQLIAKEMIVSHKVQPSGLPVESGLWNKLYTFLDLGPDSLPDEEQNKKFKANIPSKEALRKEADELRSHLEPLNSPVVFCHNDLLLKNIIYNKDKGCVHFIDHEYAMFNYEHFELGNHFAEYAGVDEIDFKYYPDKAYQLVWLRYYLEQKALDAGQSPDTVTDRDVEECYVKTNKFTLAAHMFWGLWGLVQAKYSLIDFGFLDYATLKLNEYFALKEEFLSLTLPA